MVDEDELGMKERSEDTLETSKRSHRNKTRSTGSAVKVLYPNVAIIGTVDSGKVQVLERKIMSLKLAWNIIILIYIYIILPYITYFRPINTGITETNITVTMLI